METQPKRSYKTVPGVMPSGKISEEWVLNSINKYKKSEMYKATKPSDAALRKRFMNEAKKNKKMADAEVRDKRFYGGKPKRVKANMGRSVYNAGGQPHYSNGEMPSAKEL